MRCLGVKRKKKKEKKKQTHHTTTHLREKRVSHHTVTSITGLTGSSHSRRKSSFGFTQPKGLKSSLANIDERESSKSSSCRSSVKDLKAEKGKKTKSGKQYGKDLTLPSSKFGHKDINLLKIDDVDDDSDTESDYDPSPTRS